MKVRSPHKVYVPLMSPPLTLCPPARVPPPYEGGQIPPCVNGLGKTLPGRVNAVLIPF